MPSIHQGPLIRELAEVFTSVALVTESDVFPERALQGWGRPDFGRASLLISPGADYVPPAVGGGDAVHIFSGIRSSRWQAARFREAISAGRRIGLYVEAGRRDSRLGAAARLLLYRVLALRYRSRVDFVLAIGGRGFDFYRRVGFEPQKVFEFGYFLGPPPAAAERAPQRSGVYEIAFVGSHIPLKNFGSLLVALSRLPESVCLVSVGSGPLLERHRAEAARLGVAGRVRWIEQLAPQEVRAVLEAVDLLVLPSRSDGWGAVVSEALLAGTPVICTDACGSATVVTAEELGEVLGSASPSQLGAAIGRRIRSHPPSQPARERIRAHARATISQAVGAAYLRSILLHVYGGVDRPPPPWSTAANPYPSAIT